MSRLCLLFILVFVYSCSSTHPEARRGYLYELIEQNQGWKSQVIRTKNFHILSAFRITDNTSPLNIYIEGDGYAFENRHTPSQDPTPLKPFVLKLAMQDKANNILYLARPCQYIDLNRDINCVLPNWTLRRFSPENIEALEEAIAKFTANKRNPSLVLNGFSGGAALVAHLASRLKNIQLVRTIAGNLNTKLFVEIHGDTPLRGSLEPFNTARKLQEIPQLHLVGTRDWVIPEKIVRTFVDAQNSGCAKLLKINSTHNDSTWIKLWPEILKQKVSCSD